MHNTEIIFKAAGEPEVNVCEIEKCKCKVCVKDITEGIPYNKVISSNFTNYDFLRDTNSKYICAACVWCISNPELRRNNFIADIRNLYLLKKNDLEEYLFNLSNYVSGEFVVGVTISFKKHNSFRCKVNINPDCFWIRQEDTEYIFDVKKLRPIYDLLNDAYMQFSKDEILSGQYRMASIEQFGLGKFREYEAVFRQYRGTAQFNLMIYMLNSERRNQIIQEKIKTKKEERKDGKCQKKSKSILQTEAQEMQQLALF